MKLELYNTTDRVKTIPRFRYNGKYVLQPHQSVDIESYMTSFFKPYSKVGIVVRVKSTDDVRDFEELVNGSKEDSTPALRTEYVTDPISVIEDGALKSEIISTEEHSIIDDEESEKIDDGEHEKVEEIIEDGTEIVDEAIDDSGHESMIVETSEAVKYTEEELQEKPIKELKEIAISMGITIEDARRKAPIIESILSRM